MSGSRRPSVTIYDYPEDLNPFNDGAQTTTQSSVSVELRSGKEPKNKFWTFGRSKKKRSNSFSVKSAWSGLFGKKKDSEAVAEIPERRTTISTVSTTYQNGKFGRPVPPPRASRDQQEFEEAFGTFTRRKKYSMENSMTYGSNLTVNGDPARLYNGSPQDTTTSIFGELTPKPPARRFGRVSPRPKDDIPALEFEAKDNDNRATSPSNSNRRVLVEEEGEEAPVPLRRSGRKSVPRVNVLDTSEEEDCRELSGDLSLRDENENLADHDFVFRRCSQDAVRRSNVSINSCVSTASGYSISGRKKRRAPQPPQRKDNPDDLEENSVTLRTSETELRTRESIDIAKVTEDIQEMTKQSQNIDEKIVSPTTTTTTTTTTTVILEETPKTTTTTTINPEKEEKEKEETKNNEEAVFILKTERDNTNENPVEKKSDDIEPVDEKIEETKSENNEDPDSKVEIIEVDKIEINRVIEDNLEIIKDINDNNSDDSDAEVELRKKSKTKSGLGRSDSFSVKEQIEQIEKQIKELESKKIINGNENGSTINGTATNTDVESTAKNYERSDTRLSIQANRRSFFKNMVGNDPQSGVKIEIKELPREQKDIEVVKLTDPPVEINSVLKEPVKIVELHISEPIKQLPEIVDEININPLPKPRRHSSVQNRNINGDNKLNSDKKNDNYEESVVNKNSQIFRGDSL